MLAGAKRICAATVYYASSIHDQPPSLSLTRGGAAVNGTTNGTGTHTVHNKFQLRIFAGGACHWITSEDEDANVITGATASIARKRLSVEQAIPSGRRRPGSIPGFLIGTGSEVEQQHPPHLCRRSSNPMVMP